MIVLKTHQEALEVFHFIEKEMEALCEIIPYNNKFRIKRLIKKK